MQVAVKAEGVNGLWKGAVPGFPRQETIQAVVKADWSYQESRRLWSRQTRSTQIKRDGSATIGGSKANEAEPDARSHFSAWPGKAAIPAGIRALPLLHIRFEAKERKD
eukprot:1161903-Pelagomonas_calceolata.AAC.6